MEAKKYGRHVLLDLCGGTEEAVRAMFPHCVLKDDGLWLDSHAGDDLAPGCDEHETRGPSPDLRTLRQRNLEAERAGWTWHGRKSTGEAALPIPFVAQQLAAFMLAGDGMNLYDRFDFDTAVSEDQLVPLPADADEDRKAQRASYIEHLRNATHKAPAAFEAALRDLGENADAAREVMREAVRLRADADNKFGRSDEGVRKSAEWLLHEATEVAPPTREEPPGDGGLDAAQRADLSALANGPMPVATSTRGMTYWKQVLFSRIATIDMRHPPRATSVHAIAYLKALRDPRLPNEGAFDTLTWKNNRGDKKKVGAKTVANALSAVRAACQSSP